MFDHDQLARLMGKAYHHATQSPDTSSQNGAVIVHRQADGELDVKAHGYNHFYKGIDPELEDRDEKLRRIEHAERDSIYQAANRGVVLKGAIMVCPWAACNECARAIIGSGISALVYHRQRYLLTDKRWIDSINASLGWMGAAGVHLFEYDGSVPGTKPILISGRLWHPASCEYVSPQPETRI